MRTVMLAASIEPETLQAVAELLQTFGCRQVYVFGSAATGKMSPASDLDLAVKGLPPSRYFAAVTKATNLAARHVDIVDLDRETPLVRYLLNSGELVRVL